MDDATVEERRRAAAHLEDEERMIDTTVLVWKTGHEQGESQGNLPEVNCGFGGRGLVSQAWCLGNVVRGKIMGLRNDLHDASLPDGCSYL